jgi:hypothetical protein
MWSVSDDERPVRVCQTIASEKHMFTVFWSRRDIFVIKWLGPGDKFKANYFCDVIIVKLVQALYPGEAVPRQRSIHCISRIFAGNILQGQLIFRPKSHPIIAPTIFAGCAIIRLLSFGNAEKNSKIVPRESSMSSKRKWNHF